tara:strand:+ start:55 stop:1092 length:1038 start_codon:yes stop_codon:yes gene_type:complete
MAVPSSGIISLVRIKNEVSEDDYNAGVGYTGISLQELATGVINTNSASAPNSNAPHAMSEWYGYDQDAEAAFSDAYSVAKSITTGTGQAVYIADSDAHFNFIHSDAYTISFWVKPGWSANLNTNIHLFSSTTAGSTDSSANMIRIYYHEGLNRLYYEYRSASTAKKSNFYLFHSNSGNHAAAYAAANLGTSYWSAANRGNVGDDDFTMITVAKSTTNSAGSSYAKVYWNGTWLGNGHYGANGTGQGTPSMTSVDRQIALGSNSWNYTKSGDSTETQFNDLTIWDKQLSATEISELYNSGTRLDATSHSAATNLQMYYKFENDGTDSSGNEAPNFTLSGNSNFETL